MNVVEKYEELLNNPQLQTEDLTIQVFASPWKSVQLDIVLGHLDTEKVATSYSTIRVYLKPEQIDKFIERLKIVKDFVLEKQAQSNEYNTKF